MADTSILDLSDEEFMKQGQNLLAQAGTVDNDEAEHDDAAAAEEARLKAEQEEADAKAAEEAAKAAAGDGTGNQDGEGTEGTGDVVANKDPNADPDANQDADPSKQEQQDQARGKDGKFVAKEAAQQADAGKTNAADAAAGQDGKNKDAGGQQQQAATGTVDYKAEMERLLAPFKANGRDIKVENVDEAIRLMQMGANYNKKMAGLKPNLALMKSLENNGLLNPEKLNFLIDLSKHNPEAISKLIADSGINPLDITTDKAGSYRATNHGVRDQEVELDHVLDELKEAPHFNQMLEVVGKRWNEASRKVVSENPNVLRIISAHMENGIYDLVANEVERQKLFGGLQGLSDLDAYRQVGDAMHADGKFAHLFSQPGQAADKGTKPPVAQTVVDPKPKKAEDDKRDQARRAAALSKGAAPSSKVKPDFNPLALSDEEFAKFKPTF